MTTPACPGRNYCDPSQSGCGSQTNRGLTWFYTDQDKTCDAVNECLDASASTAQNYCNNNASNYYGGTYNEYCYVGSGGCLFGIDQSNRICVRGTWNLDNQLSCCLGQLNDVGNCDPTWCPGNYNAGTCGQALQPFCAIPTNAATNPVCISWCSELANKGTCDQAMTTYCHTPANANASICTCINSTQILPSCFSAPCTAGNGYQTAAMVAVATNCPNYCQQVINCVTNGSCTIDDNNFAQNCPNDSIPSPNPTPAPSPDRIPSWIWYVALGIILFVILAVGAYFLIRRRK